VIVDHLACFEEAEAVLEIGAGTGLILEQLIARRPELEITGIDLTQAMLDIAVERLEPHPRVTLHRQNVVSLSLDLQFRRRVLLRRCLVLSCG
jgi:ubiquinone/menaquinone biosynthesis C-methylase UbiE